MQEGEDERYLKVAANCKHYVAYDLERWNGTDRFHFNAIISDQDIVETQLPTFESCIRYARGASIMCSFNEINGVPACANDFFLQTVVRLKKLFKINSCHQSLSLSFRQNINLMVLLSVIAVVSNQFCINRTTQKLLKIPLLLLCMPEPTLIVAHSIRIIHSKH